MQLVGGGMYSSGISFGSIFFFFLRKLARSDAHSSWGNPQPLVTALSNVT